MPVALIYITFFEQVINYCKDQFGKNLLCSKVYDDTDGNKYLYLQFDFYGRVEDVSYPSLLQQGGVFDSIASVMHITIDPDKLATFSYEGGIDRNGHYNESLVDGFTEAEELEIFTLTITQPEELVEVINYIKAINIDKISVLDQNYIFKNIKTINIIDKLFFYAPAVSSSMIECGKTGDFFRVTEFYDKYIGLPSTRVPYNEKMDFREKCDRESEAYNVLLAEFEKLKTQVLLLKNVISFEPEIGDVFYNLNGNYFNAVTGYFEEFRTVSNKEIDETFSNDAINPWGSQNINAYFIFRLKKPISYLPFFDFLKNTQEGSKFLSDLNNKQIPIEINFIKNEFLSLQYAIETKINKYQLDYRMKSLLRDKALYHEQNSALISRLKHIPDFYQQGHKLIEINLKPLPYVIESGLRKFNKSSNDTDLLQHGQSLLNALIKTRLFIPLEEFICNSNDQTNIEFLVDQLYGRLNSDGSIQQIYNDFCKIVAQTNFEFKCFSSLHKALCDKENTKLLNDLVTLRNRYHHAPFDGSTFLIKLKESLPTLIENYRNAFIGIELIIPESISITKHSAMLKAKLIMGFDSQFDTIKRSVDFQHLSKFICDKLCGFNSKTNEVVVFSKFLNFENIEIATIKVGLFDRVVNGNAVFEY